MNNLFRYTNVNHLTFDLNHLALDLDHYLLNDGGFIWEFDQRLAAFLEDFGQGKVKRCSDERLRISFVTKQKVAGKKLIICDPGHYAPKAAARAQEMEMVDMDMCLLEV